MMKAEAPIEPSGRRQVLLATPQPASKGPPMSTPQPPANPPKIQPRSALIKLSDGNSIPQLGMGVWEVDPDITARVVRDGIAAGYRLIDTAEGYHNEEGVGEAIRSAGVPRSELFITSKLRSSGHNRDAALKSFDATMKALQLEPTLTSCS